ncbi:Sister chromatid cohesion 1 protein 4, putative isoform 2 [Hibiscus syriacus]|uniref:Sister chromatid cohesion 1 protein 4, putative isoform 2 n=1 Tax=Hibiscus syriacus TaxID=106335 RepID=A0A6A3AIG8_HIBSY|nr:Sister chromatid cohesion 1 protein 4, putative isoform 2 [Hibiscus syriacus]
MTEKQDPSNLEAAPIECIENQAEGLALNSEFEEYDQDPGTPVPEEVHDALAGCVHVEPEHHNHIELDNSECVENAPNKSIRSHGDKTPKEHTKPEVNSLHDATSMEFKSAVRTTGGHDGLDGVEDTHYGVLHSRDRTDGECAESPSCSNVTFDLEDPARRTCSSSTCALTSDGGYLENDQASHKSEFANDTETFNNLEESCSPSNVIASNPSYSFEFPSRPTVVDGEVQACQEPTHEDAPSIPVLGSENSVLAEQNLVDLSKREEGFHPSGACTDVQGDAYQTQMSEPALCDDQLENSNTCALSDLPAPEKLLSEPSFGGPDTILPDLRFTRNMSGSGVGYGQGRISTLEPPFRALSAASAATERRPPPCTDAGGEQGRPHPKRLVALRWMMLVCTIPFVVKLSLKLDILRHEVEIQVSSIVPSTISSVVKLKLALEPGNCLLTTSGPFVVKLNLCCLESNIFRCEVEIGSEIGKLFVDNQPSLRLSFAEKSKSALKLGSCLLTTSGPFVVKLNLRCLEFNILRCEVEIGSEIGKLFIDNQRSLRREVELALSGVQYPSLGPFVVKLNLRCLESNILRCEVEIGSEIGKLFFFTSSGPFVVKLNLRCLESNILRCEVEIGSEIEKLFVDNQQSLRREVELAFGPFVVKLNLRCLESNVLRCEVEIGSEIEKLFVDKQRGPFVVKLNLRCLESNVLRCEVEIGKLFVDNQRSLRREVELALSGVQYPSLGPFVVKLNLRCLESNILRCEVEIGSEIGKLFVDNQRSLRREVELALPGVQCSSL